MQHGEPQVLLLDDGELDDVRLVLEELGAPFAHLRGAEIPATVDMPSRLLVTTSRRAVLARGWPATTRHGRTPEKIAIVTEDSNTLRSQLRRIGFDLLVRRPVHPYALRLVLLRALYGGDERRRERRLPIGYEVTVRSGLRRRSATLVDLSARGCRLVARHALGVGSRVQVTLPAELCAGRALALRGKVIRVRVEGGGWHAMALGFEGMGTEARERLQRVLKERGEGPPKLPSQQAASVGASRGAPMARSAPAQPWTQASPDPLEPDRRKHRRAAFREQVMTLGERASLILMGRDISRGGMRVDPQPGVEEGVTLRLAVYGEAEGPPFLVRARVLRDDGPDGLALVFEDVTPEIAARLESLVADLPAVEPLEDEAGAMGSVVSEILAVDAEPDPGAASDDPAADSP